VFPIDQSGELSRHTIHHVDAAHSMLSRSTLACAFAACFLAGSVGCATWRDSSDSKLTENSVETLLRKPSVRNDRVTVRAEFVPYSKNEQTTQLVNELWQHTDDSPLDWQSRQAWKENGLRISVVLSRDTMREKMAVLRTEPDEVNEFLSDASVAGDVARGMTTIPMKVGVRKELPLRHPIEGSHIVMLGGEGQIIGRTLNAAQYLISMTASPAESIGRIRLRLEPEIQHGLPRQKHVSSAAAIRISSQRESWKLEPLAIDWTTHEGTTLLIGPSESETGLAAAMLGGQDAQGTDERTLLLLHIDQVPR
jgi:hypothetical protein